MKTQISLSAATAVGLLSAILGVADLNAQVTMHTENPTAIDSSAAFRWLRNGKLYANLVYSDGRRSTYWVYKDGTFSVALTSSISGVSAAVQREIGPEGVREFVANSLSELLVEFLSFRRTRLLNSRYMSDYEASITAAGFPPEIRGDQRSLDLLRGAYTAPQVSFSGTSWQIDCVIIEHDGTVERWKFFGEAKPFQIKTWVREVVVPANQVRPLRES